MDCGRKEILAVMYNDAAETSCSLFHQSVSQSINQSIHQRPPTKRRFNVGCAHLDRIDPKTPPLGPDIESVEDDNRLRDDLLRQPEQDAGRLRELGAGEAEGALEGGGHAVELGARGRGELVDCGQGVGYGGERVLLLSFGGHLVVLWVELGWAWVGLGGLRSVGRAGSIKVCQCWPSAKT